MLFTWRFKLGIVNVDILAVFAFAFASVMLMIGLRVGIGCVGFKCRAARRREFINSEWIKTLNSFSIAMFFGELGL